MNAPYISVAFFSLVPREGCEAEMTFTNILDIPDIALVENAFLTCLKCPFYYFLLSFLCIAMIGPRLNDNWFLARLLICPKLPLG